MTLREFREDPTYKNRLIGDTLYKRLLDGWCRDYVWEHDIWLEEQHGNVEVYSDWLDLEVTDIFIENAQVVQVNLGDEE